MISTHPEKSDYILKFMEEYIDSLSKTEQDDFLN